MIKTDLLELQTSMQPGFAEVSVKGKSVKMPAAHIGGRTIVSNGKWLKIAEIHDEHWQSAAPQDPRRVVEELQRQPIKADIFAFAQKLPDTKPMFEWAFEWENLAVVPISSFKDWWENRLPQETRKNVRRAGRRGVTVKVITMDDEVARALKNIYDETPVRQGRKFWHYGKDVETVKKENSSYKETSEFIGAYLKDELIGMLKMVYLGEVASIMQIISQNKHYDKRPANALLAKAIEICEQKGIRYFVYGQYVYGRNNDGPLTEFKRRNGFEQMLVPRYFVPLTLKGKIALRLKLHLGLRRLIPRKIEAALLQLRAKAYERTARKQEQTGQAQGAEEE